MGRDSVKTCHIHKQEHCVRLVPIFNHLPEEDMDKIGKSVRQNGAGKGRVVIPGW